MNVSFNCDKENWLSVSLTAETVKEAADLVRHGLNANADSRRVFTVISGSESVTGYLSLMTRNVQQRTNVRPTP